MSIGISSVQNNISSNYQHLSSMNRINSAADDPAGLAISQELSSQATGSSVGIDNGLTAIDLANTAEGGLSSINDSLQRMRELAVQASNGTLSADDKANIQTEINQLKDSIKYDAGGTEFNTMQLLDGTFSNKNIATNPSGTGTTMSIQNTTLDSLGIADFDVTKNFDISTIDDALQKVSSARSDIGAESNGLQYSVDNNETSVANETSSLSNISDLDPYQEMSDFQKNNILQQYQIWTQKQMMQQQAGKLNLLL